MSTIPYSIYKDLLKSPYLLGTNDCYTVVREVLNRAFGVLMPNYARPEFFYDPQLDLFTKIAQEPYFEHLPVDAKFLKSGDILCFKVHNERVNHVGIYLGNNLFLHQLYNCNPREENLSMAWLRRVDIVLRHKDVEHENQTLSILEFMPNYKKVKNYVE